MLVYYRVRNEIHTMFKEPLKVQIAVISDLHLGRKDKLDQFNRNPGAEAQLYQLLDYLETHVDKIVLLGDIFETLRSKTLNKTKELKTILQYYPKFANKISNGGKYVLVKGNHDLVTGAVLGASEYLTIKENNKNILFFHGHQLDSVVADFWTKNFENVGVWLGGWLERMGIDITKKANASSKFKSLNNLWKVGGFEIAATALGKKLNADIIVTGHSHHPMKVEIENHLFLNSGTRVGGRQDMIILDTNINDYEIYKKFDPSSQSSHQMGPFIEEALS